MTTDNKALDLPPSVAAYLADPATRAGVDALLAVDADSLPPEIEWKELGDYYAARAVAELTRAELAVALLDLWNAVWAPLIPRSWRLPSPEELEETGQPVSPGQIWEEQAFYVYHDAGEQQVYTLVGLHRRQLVIAFSVERRDRPLVKAGVEGFVWHDDADWGGWMRQADGAVPDGTAVDLAHMRAEAERAMEAVADASVPKPTAKTRSPKAPRAPGPARARR